MYYKEELLEEIILHNDIVDVIGQNVHLNPKGSSHFGLCPFHNEKTPSFSVDRGKQLYYCFGCGAGGNVITFVMEYENYSFVEAVNYLAERANISLPEPEISKEMRQAINYKQKLLDIHKEAAKYFYYQTKGNKAASDYLTGRGVDDQIKKQFGIGYSNFLRDDLYKYLKHKSYTDQMLVDSGLVIADKYNKNAYYDRFFNRIMFPIFDIHNRVIGFGGRILGDGNPKYLNSPETKLFDKSKNLYGMNIARTSRKNSIILVEGYMDVISMHNAGFNNAVASLGTALTTGQGNLIKRYVNEVIIAYDSDGAGIKAALRAIPILENVGLVVRVIKIPEYKDPDDYIKNRGIEAFEKLIENAIPSFMFTIKQLESSYNFEKDPEDKTSFYKEIAKKLLQLESDIKRDNYFEAIVKEYKIIPNSLKQEMERIGKDAGIVSRKKPIEYNDKRYHLTDKDSLISAQKNLLTFIGSHKDIFMKVKEYIEPEEFIEPVYIKVATIIYGTYKELDHIEPASVINKFIELDEQNKVARIFNNDVGDLNQMQFEKMVNESVQIIKNAYIDKMAGLVSNPVELQKLIEAKRELQHLYISLNHG